VPYLQECFSGFAIWVQPLRQVKLLHVKDFVVVVVWTTAQGFVFVVSVTFVVVWVKVEHGL
jgi:hypothetical protein